MIINKIMTRLYNHTSRTSLRIALTSLVFFCTYDAALAKNETSNKIVMSGITQKHAASGSSDEPLHQTISTYVENTLKKMPAGYTCIMSPNNTKTNDCVGFSASKDTEISRTYGIFYKTSDLSESGFLFIINKNGKTLSAIESRPFQVEASVMRYGWGVENFVADSDDSFHFQTTSGSASMPDSDIFRFKLVEGRWVLSGHDHKTLSRCPDGSIGSGNSYSINFLTKKVRIVFRNNCKYVKTIEHKLATHLIPWTNFDPSNPLLGPEAYGTAWY